MFYTAIAKYMGILVSLVIAGILARLIAPEEFGIVAVVTVIITFFGIFSDFGIGPAIIQNKELLQDDLTHIFSFTIWSGVILTILFFLCSWPISFFYEQSNIVPITQSHQQTLFPTLCYINQNHSSLLPWEVFGCKLSVEQSPLLPPFAERDFMH